MSTNRKMTCVLVAVVLAAGILGYVVRGHGRAPVAAPALPTASAAVSPSTGAAVSPAAPTPAGPTLVGPSVRPSAHTPSAACGEAPDRVTKSSSAVSLLFATSSWRSCTAETTGSGVGHQGVRYTFDVTLPVFWAANPAVDAANAALKKQVDSDMSEFMAGVDQSSPVGQPEGAPFTLTESPRINQVGRLAVIQFTGEGYTGGDHGYGIDEWINIDTDTWTLLTQDQILLPAVRQAAGATRFADLVAPRIRGTTDPTCTTDAATLLQGGLGAYGKVSPSSYEQVMVVGAQDGGTLVVDFTRAYYLFAYACGAGSAAVDFSELAGLINPDFVRLATAPDSPEVAPTST